MNQAQVLDESVIDAKLAEIVNLVKQPANELKPYIDHTTSGVFYVTREQDKDTGEVKEKRTPLSSCFKHCGGGVDDDDNHYAVLEKPKHYGKPAKVIVLPLGVVGTGQGWSALQNNGVMVYSPKLSREKLADYIQEKALNISRAITKKSGWHHEGKAYILPSGEVLTKQDGLNVIYNGDKSQAEAFKGKGTVQSWNDAIGQYLAGNSRLCLAVGTALAATLLYPLGMESGGFHIHSDSSDGKTTAAKIALSIWAHPLTAKASWNGTGYAFTNLANSRNDNFMMLDEIGEATQKAVCDVAYSVLNGTSKAQGAKDGGNRTMSMWRTLLFSTGEKPIRAYVERGGKLEWQAGQETRLPSIPANAGKGLGVFDTVHDFDTGKTFADHLTRASIEHYGTVGAAFVDALLNNQESTIATARQYMDAFKATLPTMGNQAGRISDRFALVVSALQLAIDANLLPLSHEDAAQAIKQCLDDWIARSGTGNYEDRKIFEYGTAFFEQAAYNRFISVNHASPTQQNTPPKFAGLREERGDKLPLYYVLSSIFNDEICHDFDRNKVIQIYEADGWLITPTKGRHKTKTKTFNGEKNRYYVFEGSSPPCQREETE